MFGLRVFRHRFFGLKIQNSEWGIETRLRRLCRKRVPQFENPEFRVGN